MTIQTTGEISFTNIKNEFGGPTTEINLSDYYGHDIGLPTHNPGMSEKPTIAVGDFRGRNGYDGGHTPSVGHVASNSSSVVASSYTFAGTAIGNAATNRIVIVAVSINSTEAQSTSISGVTIGGVAATRAVGMKGAAIYSRNVTTGTTADIVVNISGGTVNACVITVYRMVNAASITSTWTKAEQASSGFPSMVGGSLYKNCAGVAVAFAANSATTYAKSDDIWTYCQMINVSSTRHVSAMFGRHKPFPPENFINANGQISYAVAIWR